MSPASRRLVRPDPGGAAVGVLLDLALGEPPASVPHPVALLGSALGALEHLTYADRRAAGVLHAAIGVALGGMAGGALRRTAAATQVAVAGRMLAQVARDIAAAPDLEAARAALPALVGRDPSGLDEAGVARAIIESVAENAVDAVVAPALWAAVAGAVGAGAHKAASTLDSMVGHRNPRYERFGWASARLDDALAYLPARATAALVAGVRPRRAGAVWRAVRRDAPAHPSPNAGVAEAAFAAALGVRLGGQLRYGDRTEHRPLLGDGLPPTMADVEAAVRLLRDVQLALAASLAFAGVLRRRRHWATCDPSTPPLPASARSTPTRRRRPAPARTASPSPAARSAGSKR